MKSPFQAQIESIGATYCPMSADDSSVVGLDAFHPGRAELRGLRKLQFDMVHGFAKPAESQVRDLQALLATEPADVIVSDTAFIGAQIIQELGGPPSAVFGITVAGFPSRDLAPFGLGLRPTTGLMGRLRNRALAAVVRSLVFKPMTEAVNEIRGKHGLPPTNKSGFEYAMESKLYLQLSTAGFDYARSDMPPTVRFVGPPRPLADTDWQPPAWWAELGDRPVILVNQGTVATESDQLLSPALAALADEDVLVVAVTGGPDPSRLGPLPANARVERHIPFDLLMPYVDVFVTNGGFGGVQLALSHGVPIVVAGKTEDKIEVAARVAYSGVGINLRTQQPSAAQVKTAVREVLAQPTFAKVARELQLEIAQSGRRTRPPPRSSSSPTGLTSFRRVSAARPRASPSRRTAPRCRARSAG